MSKIVIGDKIQYDGEYDDDNDLYEEFEENGFVHEVTDIDTESNLLWVVGCSYAINIDLVSPWLYDQEQIMAKLVDIVITTRKPKKWLIVDTETDEVYSSDLQYASDKKIKKMIKQLKKSLKKDQYYSSLLAIIQNNKSKGK